MTKPAQLDGVDFLIKRPLYLDIAYDKFENYARLNDTNLQRFTQQARYDLQKRTAAACQSCPHSQFRADHDRMSDKIKFSQTCSATACKVALWTRSGPMPGFYEKEREAKLAQLAAEMEEKQRQQDLIAEYKRMQAEKAAAAEAQAQRAELEDLMTFVDEEVSCHKDKPAVEGAGAW